MKNLAELINKKDWHTISNHFEPKCIAQQLSFKKGMSLVYDMLLNDEKDDEVRYFATSILQEIRNAYHEEWNSDWKYDVFLGDACYMTMRYQERYEAYKRAFERVNPPPSFLIISLACCFINPDPPLSLEEAEMLAKKAVEKELTIESVALMRGICAEKKDTVLFNYWDKIFDEVTSKKIHTQRVWPEIFANNE